MGSQTDLEMNSIYDQIGDFGRYQAFIYALTCFCSALVAPPIVMNVFTDAVPKHRCLVSFCDHEDSSYEEDFLNFTIPLDDPRSMWSECSKYETISGSRSQDGGGLCTEENFMYDTLVNCSEWVYEDGQFTSTAVTEFDLVCSRSWLRPLSVSIYQLGQLFGCFFLGHISDRFGRRVALLACILIFGFMGVGEAFAPNYAVALIMKFVKGIGGVSTFNIAFVLAVEFVGTKWRTFCGIMIEIPFALGEAATGVVAYFIRDYKWLSAVCTAPAFLMVSIYWLVPESFRWLLARGREDEALKVLQKIAKINRREIPQSLPIDVCNMNQKNVRNIERSSQNDELSLLKLISFPNMRKRTFLLFFCWIVSVLVYLGISLNSKSLSGDMYINFVVLMLIEIPGVLLAYFTIDRIGRKILLITAYLVSGLACIAAGFIPPNVNWLVITMNLIGKFGISAAFAGIVLFTSELYPTEYRTIGVGACSTCGRLGGIVAPFISKLGDDFEQLPVLIFGGLSFLAGAAIFTLPETAGTELPQTLMQSESLGESKEVCLFGCLTKRKNSAKREETS